MKLNRVVTTSSLYSVLLLALRGSVNKLRMSSLHSYYVSYACSFNSEFLNNIFMKTVILKNTFLRFVERVIIIFVIYSLFVGICLFLLQKIAAALLTSRPDYCNSFFS